MTVKKPVSMSLYELNQPALRKMIVKRFGEDNADDILQDSAVAFIKTETSCFPAKVAFRQGLENRSKAICAKRGGGFRRAAIAMDSLQSNSDNPATIAENRDELRYRLSRLSPCEQFLVAQRFVAGWSIKEIAANRKWSTGKTSKRIEWALSKMRYEKSA